LRFVREILLTICVGNEFQTDGAEYRKERLANSVQKVGLSSSGMSDERRERADWHWHTSTCRLRHVRPAGVKERWIL